MPKRLSNRLTVLADEVRRLHREAEDAVKTMTARAIEAGTLLIEAKGLVKHGEWLLWLEHAEIQPRLAQMYMRLARHRDKCETVSHLKKALTAVSDALGPPVWVCDDCGEESHRSCGCDDATADLVTEWTDAEGNVVYAEITRSAHAAGRAKHVPR